MKTLFSTLSLGLVAGLITVAIAEIAGVAFPAVINLPYAVAAFAVTGLLVVSVSDYERKPALSLELTAHPVSAPARRMVRTHAYSIRRGVEAARLAPPPKVLAFRRTPHVRYERAA